jgi:hypothetical protein
METVENLFINSIQGKPVVEGYYLNDGVRTAFKVSQDSEPEAWDRLKAALAGSALSGLVAQLGA